MSIDGPNTSLGRPEGRLPGMLHAVALTVLVAGAGGSAGLTLWAGRRNPSRVLIALFVIWVLSPFAALVWADMVSKSWSIVTRTTLHSVMLVLALGSLALYGDVVLRPPRSTPASRFLLVPLGSWLLMAIAAIISGRLARRGAANGRPGR